MRYVYGLLLGLALVACGGGDDADPAGNSAGGSPGNAKDSEVGGTAEPKPLCDGCVGTAISAEPYPYSENSTVTENRCGIITEILCAKMVQCIDFGANTMGHQNRPICPGLCNGGWDAAMMTACVSSARAVGGQPLEALPDDQWSPKFEWISMMACSDMCSSTFGSSLAAYAPELFAEGPNDVVIGCD